MPLYEYQCASCGKSIEILQKVSDEPIVICPDCGSAQLKKKVSATRFQLKGTGWYVTDFKNKDKPPKTDTAKAENEPSQSTSSDKKTSEPEPSKKAPKEDT
jgi:putative FmdB family regulatory protein